MSTVFVTAASGHIGVKLIPTLIEANTHLILPTSNAAKLQASFAPSERITIVEGSVQDPQWVETQLQTYNVDTIFLCLTGTDELFTTFNIFSCIKRTPTVKHIVYLSACGDFISPQPGIGSWLAAHALVKLPIELGLRNLQPERLTYTILGPSLFFENDVRQKTGIVKGGVYPEPLGKKGASRVSTDDIALAVKIAVLDQGRKWGGKKIMIGSKKRYSEDDISSIWTKALGKTVKCAAIDDSSLDKLEEHFREGLGPAWARDLRLMYEAIREEGFGPTDEEYQEQITFLGREPKVYEEFVTDLAEQWKLEE